MGYLANAAASQYLIECYEGVLGDGKTYSAVIHGIEAMCNGWTWAANIELNWEACVALAKDEYHTAIDPKQFIHLNDEQVPEFFKYIPGNCLVTLDEFALYFPSWDRQLVQQFENRLLAFCTQARKYQVWLIFITQDRDDLPAGLRRRLQWIWKFRDMTKIKVPFLGFSIPWLVPQIMQLRMDKQGRTLHERKWVLKRPKIFACYNTNTKYKQPFELLKLDARGQPIKLGGVKKESAMKFTVVLALFICSLFGWVWKLNKAQQAENSKMAAKAEMLQAEQVRTGKIVQEIARRPQEVPAAAASKALAPSITKSKDEQPERFLTGYEGYVKTTKAVYRVGGRCYLGLVTEANERHVLVQTEDGIVKEILWN